MRLTDEWTSVVADDQEGKTSHLNIRMDLEEFRRSGKFPYTIEIQYRFAGDSLMPSSIDTAQIEEVDRLLQPAMEKDKMAILVASILEHGVKTWLFCSRTYEPFFDRLNDLLDHLPDLPLHFEVVKDLSWGYYQELLDSIS